MKTRVDFRLLKNFGLSLSTKKKYFIRFDPCCWVIMGVWDDLELALKRGYNTTLEEYRTKIVGCKEFLYQDENKQNVFADLDENFSGHAYGFYKGFFQNLDVWTLLGLLHDDVLEGMDIPWKIARYGIYEGEEHNGYITGHGATLLNGIHYNLFSYPYFIDEVVTAWHDETDTTDTKKYLHISSVKLEDVLQDYDKTKFNSSNHWEIMPADYQDKINNTYTNLWIDHFVKDYKKIIIDDFKHLYWMKMAHDSGKHTKEFSDLFREDLLDMLAELEPKYKNIFDGTGYFMRTENVSLKYGCHGVGPYYDLKSILESCVTCVSGHSPFDDTSLECINLYLIPWVEIQYEFRVFVYNKKITAISQQNLYTKVFDYYRQVNELCKMVLDHFYYFVEKKIDWMDSYVYDVAILKGLDTSVGDVYFIEPNPFGKEYTSGSALFHWIHDKEQLHDTRGKSIRIRYIK